ncbi:hypothetical protein D3C80_1752330 [compost metagenome]
MDRFLGRPVGPVLDAAAHHRWTAEHVALGMLSDLRWQIGDVLAGHQGRNLDVGEIQAHAAL